MKSTPYSTAQLMTSTSCHVGVASLNQTAGDWRGNRHRIIEVIHQARARGVRLLLCPELCISGYSLGDRLSRTGTFEHSYQSLQCLKEHFFRQFLMVVLRQMDDAKINLNSDREKVYCL